VIVDVPAKLLDLGPFGFENFRMRSLVFWTKFRNIVDFSVLRDARLDISETKRFVPNVLSFVEVG